MQSLEQGGVYVSKGDEARGGKGRQKISSYTRGPTERETCGVYVIYFILSHWHGRGRAASEKDPSSPSSAQGLWNIGFPFRSLPLSRTQAASARHSSATSDFRFNFAFEEKRARLLIIKGPLSCLRALTCCGKILGACFVCKSRRARRIFPRIPHHPISLCLQFLGGKKNVEAENWGDGIVRVVFQFFKVFAASCSHQRALAFSFCFLIATGRSKRKHKDTEGPSSSEDIPHARKSCMNKRVWKVIPWDARNAAGVPFIPLRYKLSSDGGREKRKKKVARPWFHGWNSFPGGKGRRKKPYRIRLWQCSHGLSRWFWLFLTICHEHRSRRPLHSLIPSYELLFISQKLFRAINHSHRFFINLETCYSTIVKSRRV